MKLLKQPSPKREAHVRIFAAADQPAGSTRQVQGSLAAMAGILLLALSTAAQGHARLQKAVPADGSITAAPVSVVLSFSEPARITALWIQKTGEEKQKLTTVPATAAKDITVAVPHLAPGTYVLSWRAMGEDNHIVPGEIHFTVSAPK